jgi:hypothetical protein
MRWARVHLHKLMQRFSLAMLAVAIALGVMVWVNRTPAAAQVAQPAPSPATATATVLASDGTRTVVELVAPAYTAELVTHDGAAYAALTVPDLPSTGQPGQPQLPVYATLLGAPPGAQVAVRVLASEVATGRLPATVLPAPTPPSQSMTSARRCPNLAAMSSHRTPPPTPAAPGGRRHPQPSERWTTGAVRR